MSAISLKSITGITSITTPAGVDNQLTLHNNNTTEAVKLDIAGNVHVNNQLAVAGVTTFSDEINIIQGKVLRFGNNFNSPDLSVSYDGSVGRIQAPSTGIFLGGPVVSLKAGNLTERMLEAVHNGAVTLYYDSSTHSTAKLATTATGITVDGTTTTTGLGVTSLAVAGVTTASGMLNANGDITITSPSPTINFTENNGDPDYRIFLNGGIFNIDDVTNNVQKFSINTTRITLNGETLVNNSNFYIHDKIIHWADDDTRIRFPANDNISFDTAGSERLRITSGGAVLLGATAASNAESFRIHTSDSGKAIIKLTNSTTGTGTGDGFEFGMNANEQIEFVNKENTDMFFATNNTERLRITSSGQIGIGTATIRNNRAMQFTGASNSLFLITGNAPSICLNRDPDDSSDSDRSFFGVSSVSNGFANGTAAGDTIIRGNSSGKIHLATHTSIRLSIASGGDTTFYGSNVSLAVGTLYIPDSLVHNGDNDTKIRFPSNDTISFETAGSEKLKIESGGDVTVNTGTLYIPQWISHVGDTDSKFGFLQPDIIEFQVAGTQRLKIMNTGQIRIDQATSANNGIRMRPSGWNYDFRIGAVSSSGGSIWLGQNYEPTGGTRDNASYGTNYIRFTTQGEIMFGTGTTDTNPTQRLKIKSDGTLNVGNADSVAPWGATGNVNSGVRLINNGLTGYAISANSNDIAGIFNRTNTQGTILECKYNGVVKHALGDNFTSFYGQQNTFRYDNGGGIGAYLSILNRGSNAAGTACGIAFGCDTSDAQLDGSDTGNGQIKVRNDGSDGGIMSFNVHIGSNFEALKIVGNAHNTRNATNGNSAALKGGVAFSCAGIAIDKSWDNYPGLHVFNTTGHSDTNQGQFRFHGWNTSYNSYPQSSGSDFSVNLVCDGTGLTSDERRKTGISTITNALNTVSQLRGVKYTQVNRELKPQTHMTMDNGQKLGFIAQEVIPHLPSIVIDSGDHVQPMENGYCDRYMIDYGSVVALLTEAVKELKSKNEALEARIAALESS